MKPYFIDIVSYFFDDSDFYASTSNVKTKTDWYLESFSCVLFCLISVEFLTAPSRENAVHQVLVGLFDTIIWFRY